MSRLINEIRETRPAPGRVSAWWLGQMGFVFKKGDTTILVDGYLTDIPVRRFPPAFSAEDAVIFDAVIGSHNHADHVDKPAWKTIREVSPTTAFMAPAPCAEDIKADTGIDIVPLKEGETCMLGDFTLNCIAAAHEFIERDENGASRHLSFVIDRSVFHAGDTLVYDGQRARLREFGAFKAMILPINGRDAERYARNCIGNMTFQEAVDLAGDIKPGIAIPGHWDMFAGNTADPEEFRRYLEVKYPGVRCMVPERFERFEI